MPPRLTFSPSLSSCTRVPFGHSCSSSVTFKIYVTVHREWFQKFRSEGKRIEVWSDLPGAGRRPGEWGDTPFVEQTPSSPIISPQDLHEVDLDDEDPYLVDALTVSLLSPEDQAVQHELPGNKSLGNDKKITLIASFTLPQTYTHYSYTFRIAGPGNRLEWLGSMGSNGTVIVGEPGHRIGFEESEAGGQWSADSSSRKWERGSNETGLVEIGKFKGVEMIGWSFAKHGISEKVSTSKTNGGANLLLLHPRLDSSVASRPFTDPPSSIMISSQDETTVLTAEGLLLTSAQSVVIQEFYPFCLPTELSLATDSDWETLDSPDGSCEGFIFAKSTDSAVAGGLLPSSVPSTLAVLPSVSGDTLPPTSTVTFPLPMLRELQPNGPTSILYSPANETIKLIDLSLPHIQDTPRLSLTVGRDGGELTVVPSYEIGAAVTDEAKESEDIWQIGVLQPALSSIGVEHDVLAPEATESAVEPPSENYLASHADSEEDVVTLGTPPLERIEQLPTEVEPEETAPEHAVTEEVIVPPTSSEHEETSAPTAVAVVEDPAPTAVSLRTQPDHHYFVLIRILLTWIHVFLGLWNRVFRIGGTRLSPQQIQAIEDAGPAAPIAEAEKPVEEPVPAEKVSEPEQAQEPVAEESEDKAPTPPTTDLDAVKEPEEETEGPSPDHPKLTASKSILTPPMTPPQAHAAELVTKLSTVVEAAGPVVPPTSKTKLVFTLPPRASSFKFIIAHEGEEADIERIRLLLDQKEVMLPGDGQQVKARAVDSGMWVVDVDVSDKTHGHVEIAVV